MNKKGIFNVTKSQAKFLVFRPSWITEFPSWIPEYPYKYPIWFPYPIPNRFPQHIYYISETNHTHLEYVSLKNRPQ